MNIYPKINAKHVKRDFLRQEMNHVFIAKQEQLEVLHVNNVNIIKMKMEMKLMK